MAIVKYPLDYPEALINGYGISVNMGLVRTGMETGYFKQRRRFKNMPQSFNLTFAIPNHVLPQWQIWVNEHAYDYFHMNLTSYRTTKGECSQHTIRFTSDLAITPLTPTVFSVSVTVEEDIQSTGELRDTWIIGMKPADNVPSLPWYTGEHPINNIQTEIIAGSPQQPSVRV